MTSPERFNFESSEIPEFFRGDRHSKLHVPNVGSFDLIGEIIDEADDRLDANDERVQYEGISDDGKVIRVYQTEDLERIVVDEVTIDGETVYTRPTFH